MIDEPRIVQTSVQQTAVVRLTMTRSEIPTVMGSAIGEVLGAIESSPDPAKWQTQVNRPVRAKG